MAEYDTVIIYHNLHNLMLLGTCQHLFKETVGGAVHYIALFEAGII
jgi:hypothetical protein